MQRFPVSRLNRRVDGHWSDGLEIVIVKIKNRHGAEISTNLRNLVPENPRLSGNLPFDRRPKEIIGVCLRIKPE